MSSPDSTSNLRLAGRLGRVGTAFVIVSFFAALFAPIVIFLGRPTLLDPSVPGAGLLALFTDPANLLVIGDILAVVGHIFLIPAMALVLLGLLRRGKPRSAIALIAGLVVLLGLVAWVLLMWSSYNRARGAVDTVDAAIATGGWSVASAILLAASLAYLVLTIRVDRGAHQHRLTIHWWPVYGAINVLGSVAIAGFFVGLTSGTAVPETLSLGLVLKMTLVPVFGIVAYADLRHRFPRWAEVVGMQPAWTQAVAPVPAAVPDFAPFEATDPLATVPPQEPQPPFG